MRCDRSKCVAKSVLLGRSSRGGSYNSTTMSPVDVKQLAFRPDNCAHRYLLWTIHHVSSNCKKHGVPGILDGHCNIFLQKELCTAFPHHMVGNPTAILTWTYHQGTRLLADGRARDSAKAEKVYASLETKTGQVFQGDFDSNLGL